MKRVMVVLLLLLLSSGSTKPTVERASLPDDIPCHRPSRGIRLCTSSHISRL